MKICFEVSLLLILIMFVQSCQTGQDFSLEYISGNNQSGIVNQVLPDPIQVRVVDQDGLGIENEMVTFSVISGGGSLNISAIQTDVDGYAQAAWTLGESGIQTIEVSADVGQDSPIIFTAMLNEPHELEYISGNEQSRIWNEVLPNPLEVRVVDANGTGLENVPVTFTVITGGGSVDECIVLTNPYGYAETRWRLGSSGNQILEASAEVEQGSPLTFTATGINTFTDTRDGEEYKLVTIGDQVWFAENLRYDAVDSYSNPDNLFPEYGRLYSWSTSTTACPNGWHLPTDLEWTILEMSLGLSEADTTIVGYRGTHGTSMKSPAGWSNNATGANSSGFNAYPAGHRSIDYYELGLYAYFWTATEVIPNTLNEAFGRRLKSSQEGVDRFTISKAYYYSCRCVQD